MALTPATPLLIAAAVSLPPVKAKMPRPSAVGESPPRGAAHPTCGDAGLPPCPWPGPELSAHLYASRPTHGGSGSHQEKELLQLSSGQSVTRDTGNSRLTSALDQILVPLFSSVPAPPRMGTPSAAEPDQGLREGASGKPRQFGVETSSSPAGGLAHECISSIYRACGTDTGFETKTCGEKGARA